ncbi:putative quinol monooxygenase [Lacibacterium aquatile]|uniref:Quinol monooxygenase n=1 Tax=Lacibacterium aquatile TaxID=1168082 RepID=A0ABW5DLN1_9PROT
MAVTYLITFTLNPGAKPLFLSLLHPVLDAMRHETDFLDAHVSESPDNPDRLLLLESWADHDAVLAVEIHRPYRKAYHAALPELLAQPREISVWRTLRRDSKKISDDFTAPQQTEPGN